MKEVKCTKKRYVSQRLANRALHDQQKWGASVKRAYFCVECQGFHLTSCATKWYENGEEEGGKRRKERGRGRGKKHTKKVPLMNTKGEKGKWNNKQNTEDGYYE